MQISIHVDDAAIKAALLTATKEVPTAVRNAMRDTLKDIQKAQRVNIASVFHVTRKQFIERTVKIPKEGGMPTKDSLRGEVQIDPEKNVLAKFEEGGDFGRYGGGKYQFIPSKDIRTGTGGQVARGHALKNFLPFAMASSTNARRLAGSAMGHLSGRRTLFARDTRARLVGQKGAFFTKTSDGAPVLAMRVPGWNRLQYQYLLYPRKRITPQLFFERTALARVAGSWERNAALAIEHALKRATLA